MHVSLFFLLSSILITLPSWAFQGVATWSKGEGVASAPTGCPNIGDTCSDGSKYAGNGTYVTDMNQGSGTEWATVNVANSGSQSTTNGKSNQAWIVANRTLSQYPAFEVCENLVRHGRSDWYLPSSSELSSLYTNRSAIGSFGVLVLWSSTESTNSNGASVNFANGVAGSLSKSSDRQVRCVRKP